MTAMLFPEIDRSAVISPDGLYRYRLERRWGDGPLVGWILLNPSTADASQDDPTVRRLIGFSRAWGYGGFVLCNLFAFRATDPKQLYRRGPDVIGPDNNWHLMEMAIEAKLIVAAWGSHGMLWDRDIAVRRMIPGLKVLGLTKLGQPCHPLYQRADLMPIEWRPLYQRLDLEPVEDNSCD